MKYRPLDNKLFIRNRSNFSKKLKDNGLAIFTSNDVLPTNADGTFPFKQNADLFYLSGIDQEETILILFPNAKEASEREILFVRETNEHILTWEGYKLTKEQATTVSGIQTVYWTDDFKTVFDKLIKEAGVVYLNANEHKRAEVSIETREDRLAKWVKSEYPDMPTERAAPIMHDLRVLKSDEEIDLIKHACAITEKAFRRILKSIRPGIMEYEIEADIVHEFLKNGSRGPGYAPIIASGSDACILHYVKNDKVCSDGELILMDFGAEYANYNADLTRTVPVNGKFNKRQKEVYNAVLNVLNMAQKLLVPGNTYKNYNEQVTKCMEEELIKLGLLNSRDIADQDPKKPLYKQYFMHGISHYLGLDVHDVGDYERKFEKNMVFTCEPGIYIREEGIGIRLENDILITQDGNKNFMSSTPLEVEEIESLMKN